MGYERSDSDATRAPGLKKRTEQKRERSDRTLTAMMEECVTGERHQSAKDPCSRCGHVLVPNERQQNNIRSSAKKHMMTPMW